MTKKTKIYCPYCNRPITYEKLLRKKEVDVEVWEWAFQGIYCPYSDCGKFIDLDNEYDVIIKKKEIKNMKSFEKFVEEITKLENEYGVKLTFSLDKKLVDTMLGKEDKTAPAETPAPVEKDTAEAPKEETPKKKRGAKKEEVAEEEAPKEKAVKKTPISDESLDEIEDKANEIFDEDEDEVDAFYDHMLEQFGVENEADLYEEDKDEVMEMLKFLEDNPEAKITDAKRYGGEKKKSRRK